jgi:hypothetical protein
MPWLGAATLFMVAVAAVGCSQPRPATGPGVQSAAPLAPVATGKNRKRQAAEVDVPLSPGCPLGSVVLLGLNLPDKTCNARTRTVPAGPVGSPNLP